MSEENKIVELKDEELNQVSGGMVPKSKSSPYKEKNHTRNQHQNS